MLQKHCQRDPKTLEAPFNFQIGRLQMEGCSFDGSRLSENQRDSPTVSAVPPCYAAWIPKVKP